MVGDQLHALGLAIGKRVETDGLDPPAGSRAAAGRGDEKSGDRRGKRPAP
jgi:hypothetical protein